MAPPSFQSGNKGPLPMNKQKRIHGEAGYVSLFVPNFIWVYLKSFMCNYRLVNLRQLLDRIVMFFQQLPQQITAERDSSV